MASDPSTPGSTRSTTQAVEPLLSRRVTKRLETMNVQTMKYPDLLENPNPNAASISRINETTDHRKKQAALQVVVDDATTELEGKESDRDALDTTSKLAGLVSLSSVLGMVVTGLGMTYWGFPELLSQSAFGLLGITSVPSTKRWLNRFSKLGDIVATIKKDRKALKKLERELGQEASIADSAEKSLSLSEKNALKIGDEVTHKGKSTQIRLSELSEFTDNQAAVVRLALSDETTNEWITKQYGERPNDALLARDWTSAVSKRLLAEYIRAQNKNAPEQETLATTLYSTAELSRDARENYANEVSWHADEVLAAAYARHGVALTPYLQEGADRRTAHRLEVQQINATITATDATQTFLSHGLD